MDHTLDEIRRRERAIETCARVEDNLRRLFRSSGNMEMRERIQKSLSELSGQLDEAEEYVRLLRITRNARLDRERQILAQQRAGKRPVRFMEIQEIATV